MLDELAVAYLFLGGAGAGTMTLVSLIDLVWVHERFGIGDHVTFDGMLPVPRALATALAIGFCSVVLGVLCLMFDLGRFDRIMTLFVSPTLSYLSVGAWVLTALMVVGAGLVAVRILRVPSVPRSIVVASEVLAVALGFVAMLYTGLLLQGTQGVALWQTMWVPMLFVFSSLSCGFAIVLVALAWGERDLAVEFLIRRLIVVDGVVIVLEAVAAALIVAMALGGGHPGASASAERLLSGDMALWWLVGFAGCGLAVPIVLEAAMLMRSRCEDVSMFVVVLTAILVLIGGFSLRVALVEAGTHRELELESAEVLAPAAGISLGLTLEPSRAEATVYHLGSDELTKASDRK